MFLYKYLQTTSLLFIEPEIFKIYLSYPVKLLFEISGLFRKFYVLRNEIIHGNKAFEVLHLLRRYVLNCSSWLRMHTVAYLDNKRFISVIHGYLNRIWLDVTIEGLIHS